MSETPNQLPLLPSGRVRPAELVYWCLPVAAFFLFPDRLSFGTSVLTMTILAVSFSLVLSFAGIVSLGHAVYFGLGAYIAGLLSIGGWHEPISVVLLSGAGAALCAAALGPIVLRLSGLPMMMMTLAVGAVAYEAANKATWLTGGDNGLGDIAFDPVLGLFDWSVFGQTSYIYVLAWLFASFVLLRLVVNSPFGLALRGVRDNPLRMRLIGSPVVSQLVTAYALGAFIAGIAGALSTETTGFVGLDVIAVDLSINVLVMVVLGGVGTLYGGLVGAPVYMFVKEFAATLNPYNWMFFIGLMLVLVVLFGRGGILGALGRLRGGRPRALARPSPR